MSIESCDPTYLLLLLSLDTGLAWLWSTHPPSLSQYTKNTKHLQKLCTINYGSWSVCKLQCGYSRTVISQEVCGTPTCPSGHTFHKDNCECFTSQSPTCSGTLIPSSSLCHTKSTPKCSSGCILRMNDCTCVESPIDTSEYFALI